VISSLRILFASDSAKRLEIAATRTQNLPPQVEYHQSPQGDFVIPLLRILFASDSAKRLEIAATRTQNLPSQVEYH